jgi:NADH dehydrogenase
MANGYTTATVFGGTGFIGRYVVRRLARTGAIVRVASRHPSKALFLKSAGNVGQIVPIVTNLGEDLSLAAAVGGADVVVNLIGILHGDFDRVQGEAPGRIARAAADAHVGRFVQVSAIGADADSPSAYARSKAAGEEAVRAAFPDATILRPSIVFGPEDGFFNRFAGMSLLAPALPLIGGGATRFQPVYVGDVASAVMAAIADPATRGKTYELGGPRTYSFREMLEMMMAETGRRRALVPIPWGIAERLGKIFQALPLPAPPITADQVELLRRDNVVADGSEGLAALGITPTTVEAILPTYMDKYRLGGRFRSRNAA